MIEQLIDHLERHGRNVCAETCRFNHVNRMAQARCENFRLPTVVLINLNDVLKQVEAVLADVVQAAKERTDKRCSSLGCNDRLRSRKTESDVYPDSFV